MPRLVRHRPKPASVGCALSVDAETLPNLLKRIVSLPRSLVKLNAPETRSSVGLNVQRPTKTWTMSMTLSSITLLAQGGAQTYVLGLMLDAHSVSNKPNTDLQPKQCLTQMQAQIDRLLVERSIPNPVWEVLSKTQSPFPASVSTTLPPRNFKCRPSPYMMERWTLSHMSKPTGRG